MGKDALINKHANRRFLTTSIVVQEALSPLVIRRSNCLVRHHDQPAQRLRYVPFLVKLVEKAKTTLTRLADSGVQGVRWLEINRNYQSKSTTGALGAMGGCLHDVCHAAKHGSGGHMAKVSSAAISPPHRVKRGVAVMDHRGD